MEISNVIFISLGSDDVSQLLTSQRISVQTELHAGYYASDSDPAEIEIGVGITPEALKEIGQAIINVANITPDALKRDADPENVVKLLALALKDQPWRTPQKAEQTADPIVGRKFLTTVINITDGLLVESLPDGRYFTAYVQEYPAVTKVGDIVAVRVVSIRGTSPTWYNAVLVYD